MTKGYCSCDKLTPGTPGSPTSKMGWFERLLMRFLPHFDIIKDIPHTWEGYPCAPITTLYLRRFYIWRSSWIGKNFGDLYLHKIYRSDNDPDPHDHPWDFRTFILKGGYTDEAWMFDMASHHPGSPDDAAPYGKRRRVEHWDDVISAPATRFRSKDHIHRVILTGDRPAWTLVWTTGYRRDANGDAEWYFYTPKRKNPWRVYLGLNKDEEHGG